MKIGIITPFDSSNYGAYLQAFATNTFLKSEGHEVYFIKYRSQEERQRVFYGTRNSLKDFLKAFSMRIYNREFYRVMTDSLKEFEVIDISSAVCSKLDMIILGSDEIWNIRVSSFKKPIFYGLDLPENIPVYAYAPSSGNACYEDYRDYKSYTDEMHKIRIIGVRDDNTARVVSRATGLVPQTVCDPTLLISTDTYPILGTQTPKERYMLVYAYYIDKEEKEYIKRYAKDNELKLVCAGLHHSWCDISLCCSPFEFCSLIKNSNCVYTSTFHGTIFTFLYNKNCVINAKSEKLRDLLKWTCMKDRCVFPDMGYDEFLRVMNTKPNFERLNYIIQQKSENSKKLYISMINNGRVV
ncbi:MAG: polysaccharide pyruvyl transferase family protein [Suipraeoptans sp.]